MSLTAALRVIIPLAVGGVLAGAIAIGANGGSNGPNAQVAPKPTQTPVFEGVPSPTPRSVIVRPTAVSRAVVTDLDKGGLFGDGIKDLPKIDTEDWITYTNAKWGYSFKYPAGWEIEEFEAPPGAVPLQWVRVTNPLVERGKNVPGTNCTGVICEAATPGTLRFGVAIDRVGSECTIPGPLVADDVLLLNSRSGKRCVVEEIKGTPPVVQIAFAGQSKLIYGVLMAKGRETSTEGQTILETILGTLTLP